MTALVTLRPRNPVGQDAAHQVAPQLAFSVRGDALLLPVVAAQGKAGLQVVLHRPVEQGVGGATGLIGGGDASLLDGHVRVRVIKSRSGFSRFFSKQLQLPEVG